MEVLARMLVQLMLFQKKSVFETVKEVFMETKNTCDIPPKLRDCCIKPELPFLCPPYKKIEACIADRSDGAYLPYPEIYQTAYEECQSIKQTSAGGTNKMFSVSFSTGFK